MIERAFVLGAGLGARLRPLTDDLPKPLVPIFQKPLITFALDHLAAAGVRSFVINTHHLPQHFEALLADGHYQKFPVRLIHETIRLETGGGIKNAQASLGSEPFIVCGGDVLTDLPLEPLIEEHLRSGNDVTLGLRETGLATDIAFRDGRVLDITNRYGHAGHLDYATVSVWNGQIFHRIPPGKHISFFPILAQWIGEGGKIGGVVLNEGRWFNIGSSTEYLAAHRAISGGWRPAYVPDPAWPRPIAPDAIIEQGAQVTGFSSVGAGCRVGAGAMVQDSILWPGAEIPPRSQLNRCIVRARRRAEGTLTDAII